MVFELRLFSFVVSKRKVVPVLFLTEYHAMEAYWGSGGIATRILDFYTR
jgi:hypothetical protein